ncbi:MAG: HepT-like ribonuclease domain-containing protein [Ottowia sp.]
MSLRVLKYLYDIAAAAALITDFVGQADLADYRGHPMMRSAVERQMEIIGEALGQLSRSAPQVAQEIRGYQRAIAFRNILIHGYADIDDEIVWDVIHSSLPLLQEDVQRLQRELTAG